jgi:hypothetical protein
MLAQEVMIQVVSQVLGHSSIRMTADVYGHLLDPDRKEAASAMGAMLWDIDDSCIALYRGGLVGCFVWHSNPLDDCDGTVTNAGIGREWGRNCANSVAGAE